MNDAKLNFGDDCVYYADADKNGQPYLAKVQVATTDKRGRQTLSLLVFPATGGLMKFCQNVAHVDDAILKANPNQKRHGAWDIIANHNVREAERLERIRQRNLSMSAMPPPDLLPGANQSFSPAETVEEKIARNHAAGQSPEFICQVVGDDDGWPLDRVKEHIASLGEPKAKKGSKAKAEREPALA